MCYIPILIVPAFAVMPLMKYDFSTASVSAVRH